jgi:hypothetical protein
MTYHGDGTFHFPVMAHVPVRHISLTPRCGACGKLNPTPEHVTKCQKEQAVMDARGKRRR